MGKIRTCCFSEKAIKVSDNSCVGASNQDSQALQNRVVCVYKTKLSTQNQVFITVTWCNNIDRQGLSVTVANNPSSTLKVDTNSGYYGTKKGKQTVESNSSKIDFCWDLTLAKYDKGPEPVDDYYVAVVLDSELGLFIGDVKKFTTCCIPVARFSLVSRREHYSGNALYSTKVKFEGKGKIYDIVVKCSGQGEGLKYPVLSVSVDKRVVIHVEKLHWNFRGRQEIYLGGLMIDVLWDIHGLLCNPESGVAVFMFQTKSVCSWWLLPEKEEQQKDVYSFVIYGSTSTHVRAHREIGR
ncbi:hypothetical protein GIB67_024237 [Kingdonia uniflora]|uniref:Uncharacterized protein n=1 Tax=Kingdonia uniflora TaxID=39325 RepID=A0A7J7LZP1_9MAGN|nr:hypothetical protein GIB67_024237 [Kingdonia uniflora]